MLGKKWKPNYFTVEEVPPENTTPVSEETVTEGSGPAKEKKKKKPSQKLSTKGIVP